MSLGGDLSFLGLVKDTMNKPNSIRSFSLSSDGKNVYTANENSISFYSRNSETGDLVFIGVGEEGENGIDGLKEVRSLAVSPDGRHVYAASKGSNAVTIFSRDFSNGGLSFLGNKKDGENGVDGLEGAKTVFLSHDGRNVYVLSTIDNAIAVFSRDNLTGALAFAGMVRNPSGGGGL